MPILLPSDIQLMMGRVLTEDELELVPELIDEFTADLESTLGHSLGLEDVVDEEHFVRAYDSDVDVVASSPGSVRVLATYQGGLPDTHKVWTPARGAIRRRVIRMLAKRDDDAIGTDSVSAPGLTVRYLDEGFTESELKPVRKHRRLVAAFDRADGGVFVPLNRTPVASVTSVTIDGTAGVVGTDFRVVRNGIEVTNLWPLVIPVPTSTFG